MVSSPDGGALVWVIAGDVAGYSGPGSTLADYQAGRLGSIPAVHATPTTIIETRAHPEARG